MLRKSSLKSVMVLSLFLLFFAACGDDDSPTDSNNAAVISVEPDSLAFDAGVTTMQFTIDNTGEQTLTWQIAESLTWASVSADCGECNTEKDTVYINVDRTGLDHGIYTGALSVTSNGGSARVAVSMAVGLEPLPPLLGEYVGIYEYTTDYGEATQVSNEYPVAMRFSDYNYWMWDAGDQDAICEPAGEYVLTDVVQLLQIQVGCSGTNGDASWNPTGVFEVRLPDDSLILTQVDGTIFKELRLVPATD